MATTIQWAILCLETAFPVKSSLPDATSSLKRCTRECSFREKALSVCWSAQGRWPPATQTGVVQPYVCNPLDMGNHHRWSVIPPTRRALKEHAELVQSSSLSRVVRSKTMWSLSSEAKSWVCVAPVAYLYSRCDQRQLDAIIACQCALARLVDTQSGLVSLSEIPICRSSFDVTSRVTDWKGTKGGGGSLWRVNWSSFLHPFATVHLLPFYLNVFWEMTCTCSGKPSILFWPLVWMKQRALWGRGLVVVMGMGRGDWYCWMDTLLMAPSYCWSRAVRWGGLTEVIIIVCCWWGLWTPGCGQTLGKHLMM